MLRCLTRGAARASQSTILRSRVPLHSALASRLVSHPHLLAPSSARRYSTPIGKIDKPTYQLTFTCKACTHRSSHLVSKQAYHKGTVLIQCPSCTNRHLIADHLNVFGQGKKTLEDILREKGDGETIQHTTIDPSKLGDIQWEGPDAAPEQMRLE